MSVITGFAKRFAALEDRVAAVETTQPNVNINVDNLAFGLQDRLYRSSNVIIYGVVENRNMPNRDAIMQILFPMPGLDLTHITATRAGKLAKVLVLFQCVCHRCRMLFGYFKTGDYCLMVSTLQLIKPWIRRSSFVQ